MNILDSRLFRKILLLSVAVFALWSCGDDDEIIISSVEFNPAAVYITEYETSVDVKVTTKQSRSLSINSVPKGWTATLSGDIITVTSPKADDQEAVQSGYVGLYSYSTSDYSTYATLYVSMTLPEDLSDKRSNCYIITEGDKSYAIPINRIGEGNEAILAEKVDIIWQSPSVIMQYAQKIGDDKMSFYIKNDSEGKLIPGNALIGAYDKSGKLLTTWHIWVTDSEPQAVGRYMDRNLGANSSAHSTELEILRSYGLYYQWGRVTPFVGPMSYDCASNYNAAMYGSSSSTYAYMEYLAPTANTDLSYALQNPLQYLLGLEEFGYDWLPEHNSELWSAMGEKSIYDPCPKGWRVADSFADFEIVDDLSGDLSSLEKQFGWNMSNGEEELFFLGGGRRSWLTGYLTNMNTAVTPKPWIGYYWTSKSGANNQSEAMYFTLDTDNPAKSELHTALLQPRANGMFVRCVRE